MRGCHLRRCSRVGCLVASPSSGAMDLPLGACSLPFLSRAPQQQEAMVADDHGGVLFLMAQLQCALPAPVQQGLGCALESRIRGCKGELISLYDLNNIVTTMRCCGVHKILLFVLLSHWEPS